MKTLINSTIRGIEFSQTFEVVELHILELGREALLDALANTPYDNGAGRDLPLGEAIEPRDVRMVMKITGLGGNAVLEKMVRINTRPDFPAMNEVETARLSLRKARLILKIAKVLTSRYSSWWQGDVPALEANLREKEDEYRREKEEFRSYMRHG